MLAIVSDLHLQHISLDAVRYVRSGVVYESGVSRNVSEGALQMLFADLLGFADRARSRDVELVFAGDIFELLRSPLWFSRCAGDLRPTTQDIGPDTTDNPLRNKIHEILDAIIEDNSGFFRALRRLIQERTYDHDGRTYSVPEELVLRVHYLPGNHDRLANAWPSLRGRIRELLAMPAGDEPFPHVINRPRSEGYGVRIRHGHEYDKSNIGVEVPFAKPITLSEADYLMPCLGDYVAIDIALRLAVAFRTIYAKALHQDNEEGRSLREFYNALVEFDDVRPPTLLVVYLAKHLGKRGPELFELLRPVLLDLYLTAVESPFVQTMANRLALVRYVSDPVITLVREAIRKLSPATLESLVKRAQQWDTSNDTTRGATMASYEDGLAEGEFDIIVAGHTHNPDALPLPSDDPSEHSPFFLDSGTWRTSIRHGVGGAFGRVRTATVVLCYSDEERKLASDTRRFETWTGHLGSTSFGPYEVALGPIGESQRRLRICALRVVNIDEGDTEDGAELSLHVGLDGQDAVVRLENVHNGDRIELDMPLLDLHEELHGEFSIYGHEVDLGERSHLDADDPLPWASAYLPRDGSREFTLGRGELAMHRYAEAQIIVEYEIVA